MPLSLINKELQHENKSRIKSAADSVIARNNRASRDTYSFIEKANSFIAERATTQTSVNSTARAREQLVAKRVRTERFYKRTTEQAISCHESNTRVIATRLAWRHRHKKFDERQLQELDNFFQTLNIKDLEKENPSRRGAIVESKLTDEIIIDNPHIIKILRNSVDERNEYAAKTSKFNDSQSFTAEVVQTPIRESKTSQSEDLTPSSPMNTFRPR